MEFDKVLPENNLTGWNIEELIQRADSLREINSQRESSGAPLDVFQKLGDHDLGHFISMIAISVDLCNMTPPACSPPPPEAFAVIENLLKLAEKGNDLPSSSINVADIGRTVAVAMDYLSLNQTPTEFVEQGKSTQVAGRPEALMAAIFTIAENSVAHGGRALQIRVAGFDNQTMITLTDEGTGVDENRLRITDTDTVPKIFKEGYKGSESKGTGLGLFAAHHIIGSMGGRMNAFNVYSGDTKEKKGLCIEIILPNCTEIVV